MGSYEQIKEMAKEQGVSVKDLIALAPKNDPFYAGSEGDYEKARWFVDLWERFGYSSGVHLRRIHYQVISQDPPVKRPDGRVYQNTLNDWNFLNEASKVARYLGLIGVRAFVDRRNPDPHLLRGARVWGTSEPSVGVEDRSWSLDFAAPNFPELSKFNLRGYRGDLQPYHLEIWAEKSTMDDVLLPLCERYGVNLVTGAGEMSITSVAGLIDRARDSGKPVRIAYISDFDPAGYGMPISVARKIEYLLHQQGLDFDVRLDPLVLTLQQLERFDLPRTPIKETESRRGSFESRLGQGAVELDALEALYPGELARTVEEWIGRYYDDEIQDSANSARWEFESELEAVRDNCLADLLEEMDDLEAKYRREVELFNDAIAGIKEQVKKLDAEARTVLQEALDDGTVDAEEHPLPEARTAEETDTLFDSSLPYGQQLVHYKEHLRGQGLEEVDE